MEQEIICRAMTVDDLHTHMLDAFVRHQEITREYRKRRLGRGYRVAKLRRPRIEDATAEGNAHIIKDLFIGTVYQRQYYPGEPQVYAAFRGDQVVGYASWDRYWGKEREYAVLGRLFVSHDCRRMGLGRQLLGLCAGAARAEGAQKLYISTEPAVETQEFYKSMGCAVAQKLYGPKRDVPRELILSAAALTRISR